MKKLFGVLIALKEINKNFSVTGFYHVIDIIGDPTHFGGVKVGYVF